MINWPHYFRTYVKVGVWWSEVLISEWQRSKIKREEMRFNYLLQGLSHSDLTSSHEASPAKASATFQWHYELVTKPLENGL